MTDYEWADDKRAQHIFSGFRSSYSHNWEPRKVDNFGKAILYADATIQRLTEERDAARAENARLAEDKEKWRDIARDWKQLYRELTDHLRATLGAKVDQPTTPKDTITGRTAGGREYK